MFIVNKIFIEPMSQFFFSIPSLKTFENYTHPELLFNKNNDMEIADC